MHFGEKGEPEDDKCIIKCLKIRSVVYEQDKSQRGNKHHRFPQKNNN